MKSAYIGLDIATESARALLMDEEGNILGSASVKLAPVIRAPNGAVTQDSQSWVLAAKNLITQIEKISKTINVKPISLVISATSGTFTLVDDYGSPAAPAVMYNDARADKPLARAIFIRNEAKLLGNLSLVHTPEFVIAALLGKKPQEIPADWSHALKTGVNLESKNWDSQVLESAKNANISLPQVVAPGTELGKMGDIRIYAGMTDGCTAQISVGGSEIGSAVTILGTTMVIKLVSDKEVSGPGFYSHLLPTNNWLVGGASNLGGISFRKFSRDIKTWDREAEKNGPASFVTYPLVAKGERFPIADKNLELFSSGTSRDGTDQYRAILEGIAFAEKYAYEILAAAGAPLTGDLKTAGGGAKSAIWCKIRASVMNRPIATLKNSGSDFGASLMAIAAVNSPLDIAKGINSIKLAIGEMFYPVQSEVEVLEASYSLFKSSLGIK
jgi:D-ribulokinase